MFKLVNAVLTENKSSFNVLSTGVCKVRPTKGSVVGENRQTRYFPNFNDLSFN